MSEVVATTPARLEHAEIVIDAPAEGSGWQYGKVSMPFLRDVRALLAEFPCAPRSARQVPVHEFRAARLSVAMHEFSTIAGRAHATRAYVHRDRPLRYHTDRLNPYPCANVSVYVRERNSSGGHLVLREPGGRVVAFACQHAHALVFNGQFLHGTTPSRGRTSVTFYVPEEAGNG